MQTEEQKTSRLPVISIVIPILIILVWCVWFIGFGIMLGSSNQLNPGQEETLGIVYLLGGTTLGMLATVLLSLAGTILGAIALVKKDSRRGMAIAGIIINLLFLLPYLALFIFVLLPR